MHKSVTNVPGKREEREEESTENEREEESCVLREETKNDKHRHPLLKRSQKKRKELLP
jgi:hypothetical protein